MEARLEGSAVAAVVAGAASEGASSSLAELGEWDAAFDFSPSFESNPSPRPSPRPSSRPGLESPTLPPPSSTSEPAPSIFAPVEHGRSFDDGFAASFPEGAEDGAAFEAFEPSSPEVLGSGGGDESGGAFGATFGGGGFDETSFAGRFNNMAESEVFEEPAWKSVEEATSHPTRNSTALTPRPQLHSTSSTHPIPNPCPPTPS